MKWSVALAAFALAGCGEAEQQQTTAALALFTVDTQDELVLKTLPATRLACPGLNRYADRFEKVRVEPQYRTAIAFHIPEQSGIPDAYKAGGHNCFIEIESDGSAVLIEKMACKSVCLDQTEVPEGQLKLPLLSEEEAKRRECLTVFDYDPATKTTITRPKPEHCPQGGSETHG